MAKFYAMGNYTAKAFEGFIKDPNTDRSKAAKAAGDAVGAKMISYDALRGSFDEASSTVPDIDPFWADRVVKIAVKTTEILVAFIFIKKFSPVQNGAELMKIA